MSERSLDSFLDRSLSALLCRLDWEKGLYLAFIVLASLLRFWDLGRGVLHHDEVTHAWDSWNLYTGKGYIQDPKFHGPFLYHANALIYFLLGVGDYTARLVPALLGVILVGLPYLMRRWLGRYGALTASALLAISPCFLYYSRHLRHDIHLALATLLLVIAVFKYLEEGRTRYLYMTSAALAFAFSTKEASFILVAILGSFLFFCLIWHWYTKRRIEANNPYLDLIILIGSLCLPFLSPFPTWVLGRNIWPEVGLPDLAMLSLAFAIAAGLGFWWDWRRWLVANLICYAIFIPLFTTFFYNPRGLFSGLIGSLAYWLTQQGVRRGNQPWFYYLVLLPLYEFMPIIFALLGVGNYVRRLRGAREGGISGLFYKFSIYWTLAALVAFSLAGEKMPWLSLHMALPMILLAARFIGGVLEEIDWGEIRRRGGEPLLYLLPITCYLFLTWSGLKPRFPFQGLSLQKLEETLLWAVALLIVALLTWVVLERIRRLGARRSGQVVLFTAVLVLSLFTARYAWMASFQHSDVAVEMLIYTQSTPDVAVVMQEIERVAARLGEGKELEIYYDDEASWPFEWYLRDYPRKVYFGKEPSAPLNAPIVLVGLVNEQRVKPYLGDRYVQQRYRLRWWFPEDYRGLTPRKMVQKLRDPGSRQRLWKLIFYREIEEPLGSTDFVFYERKDLAWQVWQRKRPLVE